MINTSAAYAHYAIRTKFIQSFHEFSMEYQYRYFYIDFNLDIDNCL